MYPAVLSMSMEFLGLHRHHLEEVTKKTGPNESTAQEAASIVWLVHQEDKAGCEVWHDHASTF